MCKDPESECSTFSSLRQRELKTVISVVPECSALRRRVPQCLLLEHVRVLEDGLSKYLALELLSLELKNGKGPFFTPTCLYNIDIEHSQIHPTIYLETSGSNTKEGFAVRWMPHRSTAATSSVLGDPLKQNKQSTKQKQRTKQKSHRS